MHCMMDTGWDHAKDGLRRDIHLPQSGELLLVLRVQTGLGQTSNKVFGVLASHPNGRDPTHHKQNQGLFTAPWKDSCESGSRPFILVAHRVHTFGQPPLWQSRGLDLGMRINISSIMNVSCYYSNEELITSVLFTGRYLISHSIAQLTAHSVSELQIVFLYKSSMPLVVRNSLHVRHLHNHFSCCHHPSCDWCLCCWTPHWTACLHHDVHLGFKNMWS